MASYWYTVSAAAFSVLYFILYFLYAFKDGMLPLVLEEEGVELPVYASPQVVQQAMPSYSPQVVAPPQYVQSSPPMYSAPSHPVKN